MSEERSSLSRKLFITKKALSRLIARFYATSRQGILIYD